MAARRVAAIVTLGDGPTLERFVAECRALAREGAQVRAFFRDESIPSVCVEAIRRRLMLDGIADEASSEALLADLVAAGDVRLYACTSSMYIWGVSSQDLLPVMAGGRGLIAFLAEDLAGAFQTLTY
jgi:DsrE/DsrF-like family